MKKWATIYKASKYRDTTTGTQFEKKIEQFLVENGHKIERQVNIGKKRNDGKHIIDIRLNSVELISLKTQNVQGTAEEKVPFEIMKLQHAVDDFGYKSATLVLAGRDGTRRGHGKGTLQAKNTQIKSRSFIQTLELLTKNSSHKNI